MDLEIVCDACGKTLETVQIRKVIVESKRWNGERYELISTEDDGVDDVFICPHCDNEMTEV